MDQQKSYIEKQWWKLLKEIQTKASLDVKYLWVAGLRTPIWMHISKGGGGKRIEVYSAVTARSIQDDAMVV